MRHSNDWTHSTLIYPHWNVLRSKQDDHCHHQGKNSKGQQWHSSEWGYLIISQWRLERQGGDRIQTPVPKTSAPLMLGQQFPLPVDGCMPWGLQQWKRSPNAGMHPDCWAGPSSLSSSFICRCFTLYTYHLKWKAKKERLNDHPICLANGVAGNSFYNSWWQPFRGKAFWLGSKKLNLTNLGCQITSLTP